MSQALVPQSWSPVTPSNTVSLGSTIGLYVGGAGTVDAKGTDGLQASFVCQAGQYLTGNFQFVMASTTATSIVALRG